MADPIQPKSSIPELDTQRLFNPEGNLVEEDQEVMLPSTPAAQAETQKAVKAKQPEAPKTLQEKPTNPEQDRFARTKMMLQDSRPSGVATVTDSEVLDKMDQEDAEIAQATIDNKASLEADRVKLLAEKSRYEKRGLQAPPELESQLQQIDSTLGQSQPAEAQPALASEVVSNIEIDQEADKLRKQEIAERAQAEVELDRQARTEKAMAKVDKDFEQAKSEIPEIDPDRYWNSKSTGQKIALTLGAFFLGAAGKPEVAINNMRELMQQDIAAQKLNRDEAIRKLYQGFEMQKRQLNNQAISTSNALKKAQIASIIGKINLEQDKMYNEQLRLEQLKSGNIDPSLLDRKDQDRIVRTKDGKVQLAVNKKQAEIFNEKYSDGSDSLSALGKLLEIAEDPTAFANLYTRAESEVLIRGLIGKVRLSLFGPGVMSDYEQNLAQKIIGNPTALFALRSVEKQKLKTFKKIVQDGLETAASQAGVKIPVDKNEINKKVLMKKHGYSEELAEKALKKAGQWHAE